MHIYISNNQKALRLSKPRIKRIVTAVLGLEDQPCDEVSIHFVTSEEICRLHQQFFNDPSPTDCISLPLDDPSETHYRVLGEIFVCPETAIRYSASRQIDPVEETILYIVHGLLHLMGYDDISPKKRAFMRAAEKRHMANLTNLNLV